MKVDERGLWMIFRWPVALGVTTAAGLLGALIGDGAWDWVSCLLLVAPVVLCGVALQARE